jgi:hypothetical protein
VAGSHHFLRRLPRTTETIETLPRRIRKKPEKKAAYQKYGRTDAADSTGEPKISMAQGVRSSCASAPI